MKGSGTRAKRPKLWIVACASLGVLLVLGLWGRNASVPDRRPLDLAPSGCHAVLADRSCERPLDGKLRVWVQAEAPVVVTLDGREVAAKMTPATGGVRIDVDLPREQAAARLEVVAGGRRGAIALRAPFQPAWAAEASAAKGRGDHVNVRATVSAHEGDTDPNARAKALAFAARAELSRGNLDDAVALFRRSAVAADAAGRISDAVDDTLALSFAFSRAGRWAEARAELAPLEAKTAHYPDGRARVPYYLALATFAFGDVKASLRELASAREEATRLGLTRLEWNIRNERALALERFGRRDEAIAELRTLATDTRLDATACDRATAFLNLGFAVLVRSQEVSGPCSSTPSPRDAEAWLVKSLALNDAECPDASRVAMLHVLLADAALGMGELEQVERERARVDVREGNPTLRRDALDLEGRVRLARGDPAGAIERFERLLSLARAEGRLDDERLALEGIGESRERLGDLPRALAAFEEAEALVDAAGILVPLGDGGSYRGARDRAARARVELLVRGGREREALEVARAARARFLSNVNAVERLATLPAEVRARWDDAVARYRAERTALDVAAARDWELATSELVRVQGERAEARRRLRAALDDAIVTLPRPTTSALPPLAVDADAALFAMLARDGRPMVFVAGPAAIRVRKNEREPTTDREATTRAILDAAQPELTAAERVRLVTSSDLACLDLHRRSRRTSR